MSLRLPLLILAVSMLGLFSTAFDCVTASAQPPTRRLGSSRSSTRIRSPRGIDGGAVSRLRGLSPSRRVQATQSIDLLVQGGHVLTMDERLPEVADGAVAIDRGQIVEVGPRRELARRYRPAERLHAHGGLIVPGLINTHTHIPMTLYRGLAEDLALDEWLTKYIFPAEAQNTREPFVRIGTRLGLAEMIRGGTTTFADMYYFEDAIAEETDAAGMRAVLGQTVLDFPAPDHPSSADALAYTRTFIDRWKGSRLITPAIAPHAPYTVGEQTLRAVASLAKNTLSPVLIHLSETAKEVADIVAAHGLTPVRYLDRLGLLNEGTIAAHLIHVDDDEIDLLARREVGVAHNPESNAKIAAGVAPIPKMLERGVRVGLATDGAASNNDLSLWGEMSFAAKTHKNSGGDPRLLPARQVFEMVTIGAARALHMEHLIGSLTPGKRADLAIVDIDTLRHTPLYNLLPSLVHATFASDVRSVVVDGRVLMRNRKLLTLDESRIRREANEAGAAVVQSLSDRAR